MAAVPGLSALPEAYRFYPASSELVEDSRDTWGSRVERAVELARLLGACFTLRWTSGRQALRELLVAQRGTVNWVDRALGTAYLPGQWRADGGPWVPGRSLTTWFARPRFPGLAPFRTAEARPWGDLIHPILAGQPPGVSLEVELAPTPTIGSPPWDPPRSAPRRTGGPMTEAPLAAWERNLYEGIRSRPHRVRWEARARLRARSTLSAAALPRVSRAIASASRAAGANGWEFRRSLWPGRFRPPRFYLTDGEVAGLLPHRNGPGSFVGPAEVMGSPLLIGWEAGRAPVRLPCPETQGRHLLVLGETGIGKSSLLVRLARAATQRGAVLLLDPIGDTARRFVASLSDDQLERTTLISPVDCPVPVNALAASGADDRGRERLVADLVLALRRVRSARYSESLFWGPRLEEVASLALQAVAGRPGGTLADALALLSGQDHGASGTPAAMEASAAVHRRLVERPEDVEGARRLLAEVLGSPRLQELLADPRSTWTVADALRPDRITVVSADAESIGEGPARHLLAIYLALVWSELIVRPGASKTFVVLDEAQWYAHGSATELLRLGRRANVHLWMATQALRSLDEELREAVLTNASDFVLFRGSPDEAREFSRWVPGLLPEELVGYPRGQALVLLGKGERVLPVRTVGAPSPDGPALRAQLRALRERAHRRGLLPRDPALGTPSSTPAATGPPMTEGSEGPGIEAILDGLVRASPGPSVRVALADLRSGVGGSADPVRRLGSELRRAGVLRETGRGPSGAFWVLDRDLWLRGRSRSPGRADGLDSRSEKVRGGPTAGP